MPGQAKTQFRAAYRVARLAPRKFACQAACKTVPMEFFGPALECWTRRLPNLGGGVAYARAAARNGHSFSKAINIYLRAARQRRLRTPLRVQAA